MLGRPVQSMVKALVYRALGTPEGLVINIPINVRNRTESEVMAICSFNIYAYREKY